MAVKPPIHGRDHVPGGADPIPNWPSGGGLNWAYISGGAGTVSCPGSGTITTLPPDNTKFYTNAPAVFDSHQAGAYGNPYGIRALAVGHYLIIAQAAPYGTPTVGVQYELFERESIGLASGAFGGPMAILMGSPATADQGNVRLELVETVDGVGVTTPSLPLIMGIHNIGASSVTMMLLGVIVIQLDTDATVLS